MAKKRAAIEAGAVVPSQTLVRGLRIIDLIAQGDMRLDELALSLGTSVSTTHRLASALVEHRYLQHVQRKGYTLGPKLIEYGFAAQDRLHLPSLARPHIEALAAETKDTVHLGILESGDVIYVDKVTGNRRIQMASRIGGRFPAQNTGLGKVMLAYLPTENLNELVQLAARTTNSIGDIHSLTRVLRQIRAQGFAFDMEENEVGIRCVAAPIRSASQVVVAAVSVASVRMYMDSHRMNALAPTVKRAAESISCDLGWTGPLAKQ